MEHAMSFFSTIRSADRSPLLRDRSVEDLAPPATERVDGGASLPRHLLVSLAGITADVTSLQQRCVDAPLLQAALERILGRLDGLVDSIYQHAADPVAPSVHRPGRAADPLADALSEAPAGFADASSVAPTHRG
jgi:hypothetical protein